MQGAYEAVNAEWECFIRAKKGDESAWRELVEQHQTRLGALALLITGSPSATDDVVQETFVRAFDARIKNTSGTVSGFLGTIAYRLALKEAKRVRKNVDFEGMNLLDPDDSPLENVLNSKDIIDLIRRKDIAAQLLAIANKQDLPGALSPQLVQRILGIRAYGMVAIDPNNREKALEIIKEALKLLS